MLIVLLAASALVFIVACSNVANLILARTVRREGELVVRAALGASTGALRRVLLAESLLLCAAGAALGIVSAQPMAAVLARYASRFSVRALDFRVDSSLLWVGATLALVAAVVLALVPRLPSAGTSNGLSLSSSSVRMTRSTSRRQRIFAITQIAASFVLLAGASMLITTLIALQRTQTVLDASHVLAINVPAITYSKTDQQVVDFYKESMRRIEALPSVNKTAFGLNVPWREGPLGPGLQFSADGHVPAAGEDPRAHLRVISPGFFAALGVPIIAGRDFNDGDGQTRDPVVIVSKTLAERMFPSQDAINRHVYRTDPVLKFAPGVSTAPHRIIGVTADIDDGHVVPEPTLTVYIPFQEGPIIGGRLFIHTSANPYSLVTPVTRVIREMSADQPIEHAATLEDVRAEVLTPERLNSLVFGVFATVALAIAVVGVARAGVFGERADTGVWHPAGAWIAAAASAPRRSGRGCRYGSGGRLCRRGDRVRVGRFGWQIFPGSENAGRITHYRFCGCADSGRDCRVDDTGGTRCASRCYASTFAGSKPFGRSKQSIRTQPQCKSTGRHPQCRFHL